MSVLIALLVAGAGEARAGTTVDVREHNGWPTAVIDGQAIDLNGRLWRDGDGWIDGAQPGDVVIVPATAASDPYGWAQDAWTSREDWDYSQLDARVDRVLEAQPGARVVLRVFISAPEWWKAENKRETMLYGHGRHAIDVPGVDGKLEYPSYSSDKWREDARDAVTRFVTHVQAAPYADSVVAYWLADGEEGRWTCWGAAEGYFADYSRPQRRVFGAWLREKYGNDIRRLRAAWQHVVNPIPGMGADDEEPIAVFTWDDVRVPSQPERERHLSQSLLDPAFAPKVIDYNHFHAQQIATYITDLAATAKQACAGEKLVGLSYGHIIDHAAGKSTLQNGGHIDFARVLASGDINFIAAPSASAEAGGVWSSVRHSVASHGKIWVDEELRGPTELIASARAAIDGGARWSAGRTRSGLADLAKRAAGWDRTSVADIAVIIDHYSLSYLADGSALSKPLLHDQFKALSEIGAPYDVWMLDDLIAGRVPQYALYVMVNGFYFDTPAREAVLKHVARDDSTVLWIFAPGAIEATLSGSAALKLTGQPIGFVTREAPLRVRVTDHSHPLIDGVPKGLEYGTTEKAGPVFYSLPNRVGILGAIAVPVLADKKPAEWPGLTVREFDYWTSVYSAAPNVPAEILRGIARHAAAHLFADAGDTIHANASAIPVTANTSGEKSIRLRAAADVRDAMTGETLAEAAETITLSMRAGETRVLYVGDPGRFEAP